MSLFSIAKALKVDEALKSNIYLYHLLRNVIGRMNMLLPLEPDFAAFGILPTGAGIFLDIGANDGISARSFRIFNKTMPILSIEANPSHQPALERTKRALSGFDYRLLGAGETAGELTLYTPEFRGIVLTAYASMDRDESERRVREHMPGAAKGLRFHSTVVPIIPLDDLTLDLAFVKIDVEGFEPEVLRGLLGTLKRCKPTLMIEHVAGQEGSVLSILGPLGYEPYVYNPEARILSPFRGEPAENLFHLPSGPSSQ